MLFKQFINSFSYDKPRYSLHTDKSRFHYKVSSYDDTAKLHVILIE